MKDVLLYLKVNQYELNKIKGPSKPSRHSMLPTKVIFMICFIFFNNRPGLGASEHSFGTLRERYMPQNDNDQRV